MFINELYRKHYKFLLGTRISLKYVQGKLNEVRNIMLSRAHYSSKHGLNYYSCMIDWNYTEVKKRSGDIEKGERRLYLHLYYDAQRAVDDKAEFNTLLDLLEEELKTNNRKQEHEKLYSKYYIIKETPVRGITIAPNQETIDNAEKNYGYFVLISNCIKDPLEALEIYRLKDVIEKEFGNLKERLNMRRTSVSSEENLDGKLFVQFVALIYLFFIKKVMSDKDLFKRYTIQELMDELDIIERYEQDSKKIRIGEMTNEQKELFKQFEVELPS